MSVAVVTGEARRAQKPGWWKSIGAVLGGTLFGFFFSFVWVFPLGALDLVPLFMADATSGHGWPWRIDGPWSVLADLGPLLLSGLMVAVGIELFTVKWTFVSPRRLPVVVVAATLGWVPFSMVHSGLVAASTGVAFIAMVWITRQYSGSERKPLRWTRPRALSLIAVVLGLTATSVAFGATHPLVGDGFQSAKFDRGATSFTLLVENAGRLDVRVLSVDVPGYRVTHAATTTGEGAALAGRTIKRGEHASMTIAVASTACVSGDVDAIRVRLRVAGKTIRQIVHLPQDPGLSCD